MKAKDALIAWTPAHWACPYSAQTRGKLRIGPLLRKGDQDWTDHPHEYAFTGGAAYTAWRKYEPMKLLAMLFIEFNAMTVRDGINDAIAPDMEGASKDGPLGCL
jgi:hypothetical protein